MKKKPEAAKWTAVQYVVRGSNPDNNKVEGQVLANGKVVHVIPGPTGFGAAQEYANRMNAIGAPMPKDATKIRTKADGWRQPRDLSKVQQTIAADVLNWSIPGT